MDRPLSTSTAISSFDLLLAIRLYRLGVFGFSVVFCSALNCKHSYFSFKCTIHQTIQRIFFQVSLAVISKDPWSHTIQIRSSQNRWQLSCNPFWSKLTLNFQLNNFSPAFLLVIVVVILQINTIQQNTFLKPLKGNTNIGEKLSCHQIGVRLHLFFAVYVITWQKYFLFFF